MKSSTKVTIVVSSITALIVLFSFVGFSGITRVTSLPQKYKDWMKDIPDETALKDINIPGSHDTMALYSIGNLAGQCQSLTLEEQLNVGIRFLDIRLKNDHDSLKAVHGFVDERDTFSDIVRDSEDFLINNPSETIIMSIKEEANASNSKLSFEEVLKKHITDKWVVGNTIPEKLGDVRGKIVLFSRYPNPTIGINAYDGWLESCSFTMANNDIYVQDYYKVNDLNKKKEEIEKCFSEDGHALKINFLSGYKESSFPPSYAPSVAKDINPWINKNIKNHDKRGIVLYDFVTLKTQEAFFK